MGKSLGSRLGAIEATVAERVRYGEPVRHRSGILEMYRNQGDEVWTLDSAGNYPEIDGAIVADADLPAVRAWLAAEYGPPPDYVTEFQITFLAPPSDEMIEYVRNGPYDGD